MKMYIDLVESMDHSGSLHYWLVEITSERFIEEFQDITSAYKEPNQSDLDLEFPNPSLNRTVVATLPTEVKLDSKLEVMSWFNQCFKYPSGTTHFKFDKYYRDNSTSKYIIESDIPVALKIIGDKDSLESTWHVYKRINGVDQWVELDKGSRGTDDVFSIEEISNFDGKELAHPDYTIDLICAKLQKGGINRLLLELYNPSLSDFFDCRYSYEKLVQYFELNRVYPIEVIDENTYYVDEVEHRNSNNTKLNQMFWNVVASEEFKQAYMEVFGG